jgi:hypothetical protein
MFSILLFGLGISIRSPEIRVLMVYLVPSGSTLDAPNCEGLVSQDVRVCLGIFENYDFQSAYFESLLWRHSAHASLKTSGVVRPYN